MKIIISILLLCSIAQAQYSMEYQAEIDLSAQTDSVDIVRVPARCIIEHTAIIIDTTVANANVFTLKTKEHNVTLTTFNFVAEQDGIAATHSDYPDEPTGTLGDTVVLKYTSLGGDAVTGRVRVYLRYIELF